MPALFVKRLLLFVLANVPFYTLGVRDGNDVERRLGAPVGTRYRSQWPMRIQMEYKRALLLMTQLRHDPPEQTSLLRPSLALSPSLEAETPAKVVRVSSRTACDLKERWRA